MSTQPEAVKDLAVSQERPNDLLAIISSAAGKVDVDTMRALLDMQERVLTRNAEIEFNQDMQKAQSEMQPIVRDAENNNNHSRYARLETIDKKIRPVYTKHGFSLSFNSGEPRNQGSVRILCDVRHVGGHKQHYELEGDLDTTGAKGTSTKTSIQGLGSSVSYLRRYLTLMIFNLQLTNEDTDGAAQTKYVSQEQVNTLLDMINACDMKQQAQQAFLAFAGAARLELIPAASYERCMTALRKKLSAKQEGM